jgi:hypothetical protein
MSDLSDVTFRNSPICWPFSLSVVVAGGDWSEVMTEQLIGLAGGILLGLRWKYTILFPSIFVVGVTMICIGGVSWSNAGHLLLAIVALQAGYLCGVAVRPIAGGPRFANNWRATLHRH